MRDFGLLVGKLGPAMSTHTDLSPWVNRDTLRELRKELREHRKKPPVHRTEMAPYLEERDELNARLKLHIAVLGAGLSRVR